MTRDVYKEPWQVAALIAEMMKRSERTRARLSEVALKKLAGRLKLETSIRKQIYLDALDYGYLLYRLEGKGPTSGTVVLALSSLYAAKTFKRNEVFDDGEWAAIRNGTFAFANLRESLLSGEDDDDDDD